MPQQTRTSETGLDRRRLLQGSLGALGILPLCCTTPLLDSSSIRYDGSTLRVDLKLAPDLRRVGAARAIVDAERKLNMIVAHTAKNQFIALDRSCTHGGAQCTYNHKRRTVQCTSLNHAEYDLRGTLLHGRTHGNLRAYDVRLDGTLLLVRLQGAA